MSEVLVREATPDDVTALAALKELWARRPAPASASELRSFSHDLTGWMSTQGESLISRVAEHDGRLVGMAWLVAFDRVPDIDDRNRTTGDIQSVFVLPSYRRRGVGAALIESVLAAADQRGIRRVTVSANADALRLYARAGFQSTHLLLERRHEPEDQGNGLKSASGDFVR